MVACEHLNDLARGAGLYALPIQKAGDPVLTVYLSCRLCCAEALTVLGATPTDN